ncbi:RES family NAD+ phosphorylase [Bacillus methanolicus]|uniref:RES family NAD+ phosphorylase n=1 Tax=Bacillus methanolicus TaxID=1471 RepID=UPI002380A138|nr:RES family NAD+ phosphorylase [Bacillus methanolicus]
MLGDWKKGLTKENLLDALSELFYHDLDSWFNVSTFYCDSCVDAFIKKWPGIYSRDMDFQTNSIPLDTFYEGGRVRELFTKEEFTKLSKHMKCPNCNEFISGHIWPYDMSFDVPDNFENNVNEIASIAERTPFLLLSHPFAQQVYNEIEAFSKTMTPSNLPKPLFRARMYKRNYSYVNEDFLAPEKKIIKEGRYNHAGRQVLYLAEDELTCYYETRSPEEGIMLAKVDVPEKMKILDLMDKDLQDNNIVQAIQYSSLLSSPDEGEGWYKPHYVFTRFVADVAKSVGFEAIRYPSVRFNKGYNIVVLDYEKIKAHVKIIDFKYVPKDNFMSK